MKITKEVEEKIYAGILGKLIGVYLGRPVEGWSYQAIQDRFGEVDRYVNKDLGIPLIVADDDISGTFGFFRAMEDNQYPRNLKSSQVGNTWLNYIVEDKTILWWGGLGRSTEHTAYLHLKNGMEAPTSGSIATNGPMLAQQIGAQIFIDAFAMMCPGDPERAQAYVREAARVSHDGMAVEAAAFLGAMEADAFIESDLNALLDRNLCFVHDNYLERVIEDVRSICARSTNWREARKAIDAVYGYEKFEGPCHIIPNHAMVLASLILGENDFHRSVTIASSAAWDTDCNAGNVGCLNGIRLGLDSMVAESWMRDDVADRMLVVTSDGGSCVSDAVLETNRIVTAANVIQGSRSSSKPPVPRFSFVYKGSVQGFVPCPYREKGEGRMENGNVHGLSNGLLISPQVSKQPYCVSTPTFIDFTELAKNFSTIASPTLYEGQDITIEVEVLEGQILIEPYIVYYDRNQEEQILKIGRFDLIQGIHTVIESVPSIEGMPIFRFGLETTSLEQTSQALIRFISWDNTPVEFAQRGMMLSSIWETKPYWFQAWVSSAKQFAADFLHTFCISHPEENGIVTIGTQDWTDYKIQTNLMFSLHENAGVVIRSKGLKRYYAVVFSGHDTVTIVEQKDDVRNILGSCSFQYTQGPLYSVQVEVKEQNLTVWIDNKLYLSVSSALYNSGATGFLIEKGTMVAKDFIVHRC